MYLFDPDRGRRRRALARDKFASARARLAEAADVTKRDVQNRTTGVVAELRSALRRGPLDDETIVQRIRAAIGFVVGHPGSIEVRVADGRVTLEGPVLAHEVDALLAKVRSVAGVRSIDNRLRVYENPDGIPGLQGEPARSRGAYSFPFAQRVWSPTARLAAGVIGGGLAIAGLRRGGISGGATALGGLIFAARGATNLELRQLLGLRTDSHAITVQKTITVDAPIDEVFAMWDRVENFPRFMQHVLDVRRANGRSHWVVAGPGGVQLEWDAELTQRVPNRIIAWRSVPNSVVEHAGVVEFEPAEGGTRVNVRLSYTPPGGVLGHAAAATFGDDPKRALDEDLVRFKSLLEDGQTTAKGETVRRDELA
jgi:uncharacterized membrane protein